MKKLLFAPVLLSAIIAATACSSSDAQPSPSAAPATSPQATAAATATPAAPQQSATPEASATPAQTEAPQPTAAPQDATAAPASAATAQPKLEPASGNINISDNPQTGSDNVFISPKKVYFEGDKLVMEAFVYNGFATPASNVRDVEIQLSNESGVVAQGAFGTLQGAVIAPNAFITWKFIFQGNEIVNPNASLSKITWKVKLKNDY